MINQDKILVVDIKFKDDSELFNCGIFITGNNGEYAIQNEEMVNKKFQKLPWYAPEDGIVHFQNCMINGRTHAENVKDYVIKWINEKE